MLKVRLVALTTLVAAGALVFALVSLKRHPHQPTELASAASASASAPAAAAEPSAPSSAASGTLGAAAPSAATGHDYSQLPDGRPVPELPGTAPRSCGFGAILITHEGAQFAPRNARSKANALTLAKSLVLEAEKNFAEAAKKGDPGSLADAGSISRGILERSIEYRLFTLEKGQLFPEPVETPRGYWVMKRLR